MPLTPALTRRWTLAALAAAATTPTLAQGRPIRVAAAANLKGALEAIAARYRARTGTAPTLVFGSSGTLTTQIQQGAPYDIFLSADVAFVTRLVEAGVTEGRPVTYARGRIALFVPTGSPLKPDASLRDLGAALRDGRLKRLAIANPALAPYGRAAQQALEAAGLWQAAQPALVLGENVAQATQFATSGNAQAGIVAYTLLLAPEVARRGRTALIPEARHEPIDQAMTLLKGASQEARAFFAYIQGGEARAVFDRFGFTRPPSGA